MPSWLDMSHLHHWLENIVNQLESELADLKIDFQKLDMIYSNSTYCCENQLTAKPCENCTVLKNQVFKNVCKIPRGKANLQVILGSQNCVFGEVGLGYNLVF